MNQDHTPKIAFLLILGGIVVLLVACRPTSVSDTAVVDADPTATLPSAWLTRPPTPMIASADPATATPSATATATAVSEQAWTIGVDSAVPVDLIIAAQAVAAAQPARWRWVGTAGADVRLVVGDETAAPLATWLYTVAAPFATIPAGMTESVLLAGWQSGQNELGPLLLTAETAAALAPVLGEAAAVEVAPKELVDALWAQRPAWSLVPFHELTPALKVLAVAEQSPLTTDFDAENYPLQVSVGLIGEDTAVAEFLAAWKGPVTNYDPDKITRVAMTGVTALVRATAAQMEVNGVTWPGEEVAAVMQAADIAHVSNEVSFTPDCPYPNPVGGTSFCSREHYVDLLTFIGTDVVELTGNHVNDYGADGFAHTLDMYAEAALVTFGGGRNLEEAAEPALFSHNGNEIAFVGCNDFGPAGAWATAVRPGSRPCDGTMQDQIAQLRAAGHVVIATLQYAEYYHYEPTAVQRADFQALIDAGATVVSGSQGHHAQGFDLYQNGFIHYGLGNLFFDQMNWLGTRQTFVDTYVIYDGRLLSVQLWTGLIEQFARPRQMIPAERAQLLLTVFAASGW